MEAAPGGRQYSSLNLDQATINYPDPNLLPNPNLLVEYSIKRAVGLQAFARWLCASR